MADFVAVLNKTIGGLSENTPEMRQRVYEKARATIAAKLAALSPPPSEAVVARQKGLLEEAIAEVEASHAAQEAAASAAAAPEPEPAPEPPRPEPAAEPASPAPAADRAPPATAHAEPPAPREPETPAAAAGQAAESVAPGPGTTAAADEPAGRTDEEPAREPDESEPLEPAAAVPPPRRRGRRGVGGMIAALVVLLVLAGAGYAVWLNRAEIGPMLGFGAAPEAPVAIDTEDGAQPETAADDEAPPADGDAGQEQAAAPAEPAPAAPTAPADEAPQKFTQRLLSDGTEVDEGPAGGEPGLGEGTSVAAANPPPEGETGAAAEPSAEVPVGQKAIFYEEGTNAAQGSAESGATVWSLVQESPGADQPPEPAIRAEATIPGKDLQLRMTIRRNADPSLPASHIIEMIFLTPDNFAEGGIDNVLRVAMKQSEEDTGNPLLGIPAKIADGFFLLALSDSQAELEANRTLLRRQSWIDIPIIYRSGRRALITMEKGIPGDKVFDEALDAWQAATSG
ncbi:hypothetical protein N1F89_04025 [Aquibium sp. A9E412]|uniref:hypothetical protein n=1 Tax=Aquibium sp. A9E412 TaxID=2976767 RepID=UPI0025AF59CC|nr:hypothetical protein [Aquibium sp. A9E412]MDN2565378.1 hypothetical protein [Aquibium sp. A9E412]